MTTPIRMRSSTAATPPRAAQMVTPSATELALLVTAGHVTLASSLRVLVFSGLSVASHSHVGGIGGTLVVGGLVEFVGALVVGETSSDVLMVVGK